MRGLALTLELTSFSFSVLDLQIEVKGCRVLASSAVAGMAIDQCVQPIDKDCTVSPKEVQRKSDLQPRRSGVDTHSLASVAKHNKPHDCWVIIREKVYNVTAWVPQHPGGALIYINAGKDCTQLFDSYHPLYVRYILCMCRRLKPILTLVC